MFQDLAKLNDKEKTVLSKQQRSYQPEDLPPAGHPQMEYFSLPQSKPPREQSASLHTQSREQSSYGRRPSQDEHSNLAEKHLLKYLSSKGESQMIEKFAKQVT